MRLNLWLRELERKGLISRHPHPILIFMLTILIFFLGVEAYKFNPNIGYLLFSLGFITFIFSILHWIVWMHLTQKPIHRTHPLHRRYSQKKHR